jgi:hypothetical protein
MLHLLLVCLLWAPWASATPGCIGSTCSTCLKSSPACGWCQQTMQCAAGSGAFTSWGSVSFSFISLTQPGSQATRLEAQPVQEIPGPGHRALVRVSASLTCIIEHAFAHWKKKKRKKEKQRERESLANIFTYSCQLHTLHRLRLLQQPGRLRLVCDHVNVCAGQCCGPRDQRVSCLAVLLLSWSGPHPCVRHSR